jgi:hypothetical protein
MKQIDKRVVALDLGRDGILGPVRRATDDLDIGLVVSNAGTGDPGVHVTVLVPVVNTPVVARIGIDKIGLSMIRARLAASQPAH